MFWKTYRFQTGQKYSREGLSEWSCNHRYRLEEEFQDGFIRLRALNFFSLFSIKIYESRQEKYWHYQLYFTPAVWVLPAMAGAVYGFTWLLTRDYRGTAYSWALKIMLAACILLALNYHISASRVKLELMNILIPDYLNTAEGRLEQYRTNNSLLSGFGKWFNNLYLIFMSLFLLLVLLWMLDILDPARVLRCILTPFTSS